MNFDWELFPFQQKIIDSRRKKHRHFVAARQIGMSRTLAREMVMCFDESARPQVVIAPTMKEAKFIGAYIKRDAVIALKEGVDYLMLSPVSSLPDDSFFGVCDVYVENYGWASVSAFHAMRRLAEELAGVCGRITWTNSGDVPVRDNIAAQRFRNNDPACQVISLEAAIAGGFDRMDIDQIRKEYEKPEQFESLFLC